MAEVLHQKALAGKTVLLTGAAGGIGQETAMTFAKLGATVLLTDRDREQGQRAAQRIERKFPGAAAFYEADLADEAQVQALGSRVLARHGCPDVVFHNAAVVPVGGVAELRPSDWEQGYAVNLKAPVLLTTLLLPHMQRRGSGCFVFVSSSGAAPYMGAYEVFKTAQVEFANTLAMELEGSGVCAYTIGPGLVKTPTAEKSIAVIAAKMGLGLDEFYQMNAAHLLDAEAAGRGFALSVLRAPQYHGREIASVQVLNDFADVAPAGGTPAVWELAAVRGPLACVIATYEQQYAGWQTRNVFERQWVLRDFKKQVGAPADQVQDTLRELKAALAQGRAPAALPRELFAKLKGYWEHQRALLQGYERDPARRAENTAILNQWIADLDALLALLEMR